MEKLVSIILGIPKHGWLPVNLQIHKYCLDFTASDGLNDPTEELYNVVANLQDNEIKRTIWWLEPGAYYIDFERRAHIFALTILETEDLHNDSAGEKQLIKITGDHKEVIEPFHIALKRFYSKIYAENNWQYTLDKTKINGL